MNYEETLEYMYSQLPMYQRVGNVALKKGLDNIKAYCEALRNPQKFFKTIHIGGTNGKGSSSHTLAAMLQAEGYKVGLYTSPHLKNFTERIKINGKEISETQVVDFIARTKSIIEDIKPSFFEMTVAMAFDHFAREQVNIAVIEVGLGGRLDSTNIIHPEISLITNIGYDHQQFLGETLPEIAFEKAGIIKAHRPVVISEEQEEVSEVFVKKAADEQAPIYFASRNWEITAQGEALYNGMTFISPLKMSLQGVHQHKNLVGILQTALLLGLSKESMEQGIAQVRQMTGLKGRWQQLGENPAVYCDVGHNKDGIREVLKQIASIPHQQLHIVWGMANDKKRDDILALLPTDAKYYFCKPQIPRGYEALLLKEEAASFDLHGEAYTSVEEAINAAYAQAATADMVFIGGSTFVVAEIPNL